MAKNTIPGIKAGGGLLAKVIGTMVLLAVLVLVVKHPGDAATAVNGAISTGSDAIDGIVTFFRGLSAH